MKILKNAFNFNKLHTTNKIQKKKRGGEKNQCNITNDAQYRLIFESTGSIGLMSLRVIALNTLHTAIGFTI